MIGVFGHQHMSDGRLCRQPGLDQSCRCWSLRYAVGAGTAGVFSILYVTLRQSKKNGVLLRGSMCLEAVVRRLKHNA